MNPLLAQQPATPAAAPAPNPLTAAPSGAMPQGNPLSTPPIGPEKLDTYVQHNEYMSRALTKLMAKPDVSTDDILTAISDAVKNGSVTAQQAAQEISQMPTQQDQLHDFLQAHFFKNAMVGRHLKRMKAVHVATGAARG